MSAWLSVIVPTIGRPTLERTLRSVRDQVSADDVELIVVGDSLGGDFEEGLTWAEALTAAHHGRFVRFAGTSHSYGQEQRQHGAEIARGQWLSWLQDDDIYAPEAFQKIERFAKDGINEPILFRTWLHHGGRAVWERQGHIVVGNVDANCIVVPNVQEKLGTWSPEYLGDFNFIYTTYQKWGGRMRWKRDIIAEARPGNGLGSL